MMQWPANKSICTSDFSETMMPSVILPKVNVFAPKITLKNTDENICSSK